MAKYSGLILTHQCLIIVHANLSPVFVQMGVFAPEKGQMT